MRSSSITPPLAAIVLAAATTVSAQSPNGTEPAVNGTFGVAYNTTLIDGSQPLLFAPSRRWYHDAIAEFQKADPHRLHSLAEPTQHLGRGQLAR